MMRTFMRHIERRDRQWYLSIQSLHGRYRTVDRTASFIGRYGPVVYFIEMGLILIASLFGRSAYDAPYALYAVLVAIAAALTTKFVIDPIAKHVGRVRPFVTERLIPLVHKDPNDPSFPSNHAGGAFALCTILSLAFPQIIWFTLGLAVLIALSRVYIGLHYMTDVVAGACIGMCISFVYWKVWF